MYENQSFSDASTPASMSIGTCLGEFTTTVFPQPPARKKESKQPPGPGTENFEIAPREAQGEIWRAAPSFLFCAIGFPWGRRKKNPKTLASTLIHLTMQTGMMTNANNHKAPTST